MDLKNQKKFSVLKIIAIESGTKNSLNLEKDTCQWQSMCYETPLRFNISRSEIFFKSGSLREMKKYDEILLMQIFQFLGGGSLACWLSKGVLKQCFLESSLTKSFSACNFRNKVALTISFFFKMLKIWCRLEKWQKKSERVFGFKDNCIWIAHDKFSQSRPGYLSLAVNLLRNTPRI